MGVEWLLVFNDELECVEHFVEEFGWGEAADVDKVLYGFWFGW